MTSGVLDTVAIDSALADAHRAFVAARPRTAAMHERAVAVLPGGNTRTVLFHRPFPLRVVKAWDAVLEDADGHRYVDLLGEYSAGLYGHSHPVLVQVMTDALHEGLSPGAHTERELHLAEAVCARFDSIERVRFTNSGTEANLMALAAARAHTRRDRIVVFHGGYHGGVLTFVHGPSRVNAPYDVRVASYNDAAAAAALLHDNADSIACVLVEPMLGSGGCIPGERDFLAALRTATTEIGALLIFDEVMTSRTGAGGLQGRVGIAPDLTTLGKYLGGGASFGAFGGRADVMSVFDPSRPDALPHAGTFNNNVISMAAGHAGLTRIYTPRVAEEHTARGDALRERLNTKLAAGGAPFQATGVGSLLTVHPVTGAISRPDDLVRADSRLRELLFLDLLERGYYLAPRGYLALSLAVSAADLDGFLDAVADVLDARRSLWAG